MIRRPPRATRTATPVPITTLFRSQRKGGIAGSAGVDGGRNRGGHLAGHESTRIRGPDRGLRLRTGGKLAVPGDHDGHLLHEDERSEEHTSELQSLMLISYAVICLQNKIMY